MTTTNEYGTATGYFVPNDNFIKRGEYKRTTLDDEKAKADILVTAIDSHYEISIILSGVEGAVKGRFTFGVEMECFVNRGAIRIAAERTSMEYEYEGYNHRDGHSYFKFTTDSSVRGMADPVECVSPVLTGNDGKRMLKNACKTLNIANAKVNAT